MKQLLKAVLRHLGYDLVRHRSESDAFLDFSPEQRNIVSAVKPYTMTSDARLAALLHAVDYVVQNDIPGDIAECGVWRGGSMMTVARSLLDHGDKSRSLYLYDTFEGMPPPAEIDRNLNSIPAAAELERDAPRTGVWCYASLADVQSNILSTGYPEDKVHLIQGKVEETIPLKLPAKLALLRLDTDWYESTKHELTHLYPLLEPNGVLIIDDYGHWQGAKAAVDEYFRARGQLVYLHRIDYTGRLLVKRSH
jgi:O-methyltransferase